MKELSTHRRRRGLSKYVHIGLPPSGGGGTQGTFTHHRNLNNVEKMIIFPKAQFERQVFQKSLKIQFFYCIFQTLFKNFQTICVFVQT